MRFNSLGVAATGFTTIGVDGATPVNLVGVVAGFPTGPSWLTDTELFFQYSPARLGKYNITTDVLTQIDPNGANAGFAGNSVWGAFLTTTGVRTNVGGLGPFPAASLLDVSPGGRTLICTQYQQGLGLRVYTPAGAFLRAYNVQIFGELTAWLRGDVVAYRTSQGWHLSNVATGAGISYLQRTDDTVNWVVPVDNGGTLWILERTGGIWIRQPNSNQAYNVGYSGAAFNPDVMLISPGVVRIGMCANAGETPSSLVVVDLTLATGATSVGTVIAGVLTFAPGPTLTLGAITTGGTTVGGGAGAAGGQVSPGSDVHRQVRKTGTELVPHAGGTFFGVSVTDPAGRLTTLPFEKDGTGVLTSGGPSWVPPDDYVQTLLDSISAVHGSILYRGAAAWQALAPGVAGQVLVTNGAGMDPAWGTSSSGGAGGHLHGLQRVLGDGATTTFNLLDFAEYLEHVGVNGAFRDPALFALSADGAQIVFAAAPGAGEVCAIEYVIRNL